MMNMKKMLQIILVSGLVAQAGFAAYDYEEKAFNVGHSVSPEVQKLAEEYAKNHDATYGDTGLDAIGFGPRKEKVSFVVSKQLALSEDAQKKMYATLKNIVSKIKDKAGKVVEQVKEADKKKEDRTAIEKTASEILHQIAFGSQSWLYIQNNLPLLMKAMNHKDVDLGNLDYALSQNTQLLQMLGFTGKEDDLCKRFFANIKTNVQHYARIQSYVHGKLKVDSTSTEENNIAEFLVKRAAMLVQANRIDNQKESFNFDESSDIDAELAKLENMQDSQYEVMRAIATIDIDRKARALHLFIEQIFKVEKKRFTLTGSLFGDGGVGLGLLAAAYVGAYKFECISQDSSYAKPAELGLHLVTELKKKVSSLFPGDSV